MNKNNMIRKGLVVILLYVLLFGHINVSFATSTNDALTTVKYHRIISLKPNITKLLESLGVSKEIIGVTKFCEKPHATAVIIGDYNSIDLETIIRLKPDLILGSNENSQKKQYQQLIRANLNLKVFDFYNYEQMKTSLQSIGTLLHREERAQEIALNMDRQLNQLKEINSLESKRNKTFIAIVQRRPLMLASGDTFISTLLEKAGLRNSFRLNQISYPVVDEEEVVRELVDYTFDFSHDVKEEDSYFLNKKIVPLKLHDYLAAPQSVANLVEVFKMNNQQPR
ncbi:MAG: helical backbone metal receptor [bacterium]|nr:ABC transporter substrate-binding protein [bacterium]MBU1917187.1 ABC transporter substrate-binding protein [bacterium]